MYLLIGVLDDKNFSNGATYADLDNDGDLEIIVNNVDQEAQIYKNNSNNNFVRVKLKGDGGNIFGIDSRVYIETENSSSDARTYNVKRISILCFSIS